MTELTTDQRVALALIPTMQAIAVAEKTFAAIADDDTDLARTAQQSADVQATIGERVLELSEALAAGSVRIVDEAALVHEVARALTPPAGDWEKQISAAQGLVLRLWKTTGVLR